MENLNINRPTINVSKQDSEGVFTVTVSVRIFESGKPLKETVVNITVGDERLTTPKHPITGNETHWKTNNNGYLDFEFKRREGSYRISLWVGTEEPIILSPIKLEVPKLKGFDFTNPVEIKGEKGEFFLKLSCTDEKNNSSSGTIEFETQPGPKNTIVVENTLGEELGEGEKFSVTVPRDGLSIKMHNPDSLPVIATLVERRTTVKTITFPEQDKPRIQKASSFMLSTLQPNPLSDGSYVLKINLEHEGQPASGKVAFITEPEIDVFNHENGKWLAKTGSGGKPPEIPITSLGKYVRIKPKKPLLHVYKMDVHLSGTSFTKTVELTLDKKNGRKPVKISPIDWYSIDKKGTYCIPIALLDENEKAFGENGKIFYSADLKTKAGLNKTSELNDVGIVDIVPFDIPPEGANLIVQFEGRSCNIFIGLECGAATEILELY